MKQLFDYFPVLVFFGLKLGRPLFLEGEAGVGKTEIAKVLAETLGRRLVRLQCYEGLDVAAGQQGQGVVDGGGQGGGCFGHSG